MPGSAAVATMLISARAQLEQKLINLLKERSALSPDTAIRVDEPEYQNILSQSKVPHAIYHISWLKEGSSVGTVYFDEEEYSKSWKLSSVLFLAIIGSVAFVTVIILLVSFL